MKVVLNGEHKGYRYEVYQCGTGYAGRILDLPQYDFGEVDDPKDMEEIIKEDIDSGEL